VVEVKIPQLSQLLPALVTVGLPSESLSTCLDMTELMAQSPFDWPKGASRSMMRNSLPLQKAARLTQSLPNFLLGPLAKDL